MNIVKRGNPKIGPYELLITFGTVLIYNDTEHSCTFTELNFVLTILHHIDIDK